MGLGEITAIEVDFTYSNIGTPVDSSASIPDGSKILRASVLVTTQFAGGAAPTILVTSHGTGNRSDSGAMIAIIQSGADYFFPPEGMGFDKFSPYYLYLDADINGDGGLVAAYGCEP